MTSVPLMVLMGLRASGKSTVGRVLAARVGGVFVDLDSVVCERLGVDDASEAFARFGETGFREAESEALSDVLGAAGDGRAVLALGGGTPTAPGAAETLTNAAEEGRALVVYLHAIAEDLAERLRAEPGAAGRPSLTGGDIADEVGAVHAARDGHYRSIAAGSGGIVEVGGGASIDSVVDELTRLWSRA